MKGEGGIGGSLNDSLWIKASTDKAVYGVIARGRKNTQMTPYEALGEDVIWKLVGFMRQLLGGPPAGKEVPKPSPAVTARQEGFERKEVSEPSSPVVARQVDTNPYADDPAAIEEAGKMFRDICSHCHGMKGEGGIGGSLNDSLWIKASTDKAVYGLIARGRKNTQMTPYEALGEDVIWKLVGFMRKLLDEGA